MADAAGAHPVESSQAGNETGNVDSGRPRKTQAAKFTIASLKCIPLSPMPQHL